MDVVMFSHNDLDGTVSNLIMQVYIQTCLKPDKITTKFCNYHNIDSEVLGYYNSFEYNPNNMIVVTDISVKKETAKVMEEKSQFKILIDHHDTAVEELSHEGQLLFNWMDIEEGHSASYMAYKYVDKECSPEFRDNVLKHYQELVFLTDQWDSQERTTEIYRNNEKKIKDLLLLHNVVGQQSFKARFYTNPKVEFDIIETTQINTVNKYRNDTLKYSRLTVLSKTTDYGQDVLVGFCFSDRYKSELAEYHCEMNKELDVIFVIDMNGCAISVRRNNHSMTDIGVLAESFGGGGHPYAAGIAFKLEEFFNVFKRIVTGDYSTPQEVVENDS